MASVVGRIPDEARTVALPYFIAMLKQGAHLSDEDMVRSGAARLTDAQQLHELVASSVTDNFSTSITHSLSDDFMSQCVDAVLTVSEIEP